MSERETLQTLAETIEEVTPRNALADAVSDQIVHRAQASMADVYSHALSTIQSLREKLDHVEASINQKKQHAEQAIVTFVGLVNDSMLAAREIDMAITRVGDNANQ